MLDTDCLHSFSYLYLARYWEPINVTTLSVTLKLLISSQWTWARSNSKTFGETPNRNLFRVLLDISYYWQVNACCQMLFTVSTNVHARQGAVLQSCSLSHPPTTNISLPLPSKLAPILVRRARHILQMWSVAKIDLFSNRAAFPILDLGWFVILRLAKQDCRSRDVRPHSWDEPIQLSEWNQH